jgi:3-oxoacyl-[acyl-carrier protein] reductase
VTDAASLDAAFTEVEQQLGPVEIVVANAGITKDTLLLRMTEDDFDSVVATNLGGTFRVVKRASKGMLRAKVGRVILISSVVGLYGSRARSTTRRRRRRSSASRARSRASSAVAASPPTSSPRLHRDRHDRRTARRDAGRVQAEHPRGPFRDADEVAGVVTWLASEDAAYISGAVIPVDGGLGMGH